MFGPLFFYTTICICLESLACQKCYLIRLPLDLVKTSLHLHHCTVKHFVLNTEPSASAQCLPIFLFSFTSFLLFCRRAQHVIVHSRYCWQSVTFRWECTMALQVTFIHYQTSITVKYSAQLLICVTCIVTVEVESNLPSVISANSQMSWSLILKLLSTFPRALLLCFEIISLGSNMLLSEVI